MRVPFLDLRAAYDELRDELDAAYHRVMESGWYVLGGELEAFEAEFANYCGTRHCIGVGNGLDALTLICRAADIGAGDEVIVPANTYIATWLAISYAGAIPVPVEADPDSYNIDVTRIEEAITARTRAVVAVHLYGRPADMASIVPVARRHGLLVIEDAAQAHGGRVADQRTGSLGDVAGFSFYPGKNLGGFGDGGAVTTNDDQLAARIKVLRNYGARTKYYNDVPGINSRLDPLQAAFLRVKLAHLSAWNERRRRIAEQYAESLRSVDGVIVPDPSRTPGHAWHLFVIRSRHRDALAQYLRTAGIDTLVHYPVPPHRSGAYRTTAAGQSVLAVADELAATVLSLPIGPHLEPSEARSVADGVREFATRIPGA